jgi:hypothetical protein
MLGNIADSGLRGEGDHGDGGGGGGRSSYEAPRSPPPRLVVSRNVCGLANDVDDSNVRIQMMIYRKRSRSLGG